MNADNDILVDDYARLISEKEDLTEKMSEQIIVLITLIPTVQNVQLIHYAPE